jgi:hypothetical protein
MEKRVNVPKEEHCDSATGEDGDRKEWCAGNQPAQATCEAQADEHPVLQL